MPITLQFTASEPAGLTSWTLTPSLPPSVGAFAECGATVYTQDDLLGTLDRSYPRDYVLGLQLTQNSGYELFYANAKVGARVSVGIGNFECDSFVISALGGARAVGTLEIWKTNPSAFTLKHGSTFTSVDGRRFRTTEDQDFDALNLGPFSVPIESVSVGYEYNVPGESVARNGEILNGAIVQIGALIIEPATFDNTIQIRQVLPTTGGRGAALDGLGNDLLVVRVQYESDDEYRLRIKETPDTVSPAAIRRGVNRILQARDPAWTCVLHEIGYPSFPGFFFDAGSSQDTPQNPDRNFAWDMQPSLRASDRLKLFMNLIDFRGFFLVEVPRINDVRDFGFTYDVSPSASYPLSNAYDVPDVDAKDSAYDGYSTYSGAFYKSIWELLLAKHAAGVGFNLIQTLT